VLFFAFLVFYQIQLRANKNVGGVILVHYSDKSDSSSHQAIRYLSGIRTRIKLMASCVIFELAGPYNAGLKPGADTF
jgi:hypothetical protein